MRLPSCTYATFWGLCLVLVCMLSACAGTKAPAPDAAAKQAEPAEVKLDSLRAKMAITLVDENGKEQNLDAVLFSVPRQRYRMEFTGPMGIGVASML